MNMKIDDTQIIWKNFSGRRKIFTKNKNNSTLDFWNPYRSKIAAAIFNGLEIFPFNENTKIFYLTDNPSDETSLHFSNIIKSNEKIYTKNDKLNLKSHSLDIIFIDKNDDKLILDSIDELANLLRVDGFLFFSVSLSLKPKKFKNHTNFLIREIKQKNFSLIQEVNLSSYFMDHMLVILQKNE